MYLLFAVLTVDEELQASLVIVIATGLIIESEA